MKKVTVMGANGKLGSRIVHLLNSAEDLVFIGAITRDNTTFGLIDECDVIIDVSSASGTYSLINELLGRESDKPLIIGTTGDLPMDLIRDYATRAPLALISNFSKGIPQLIEWIRTIDSDEWDINIEETHHIHKKDAPSGTAKTLANELKHKIDLNDIKSYREGEVIGEHTLVLSSSMETISITHSAKSRDLFADGALRYSRWILEKKSGLYTGMHSDLKRFSKYSGSGNDFIIFNEDTVSGLDVPEFAKKICCRRKSIGADGLILVDHRFSDNIIRWILYNSDGSVASMCGNGARCIVQYCVDNNIVMTTQKLTLLNKTSFIHTKVMFNSDNTFSIMMPDIYNNFNTHRYTEIFGTFTKRLIVPIHVARVDVGAPHIVYMFSEPVEDNLLTKFGDYMRTRNKLDANINFCWVVGEKLHVRTYEKGVNCETLACGTGCCACIYTWPVFKSLYETVTKSGDSLFFNVDNLLSISMYGPASKIYDGIFDAS
jgi:diaminopimelate epimerase